MKIQGKSWKKHKGDMLLGLRTVDPESKSHSDFQWPLRVGAWVEAPDWKPIKECGNGLHYLPWGQGDGHLLNWGVDAIWLVVAVQRPYINLDGKSKCKRCRVVHVGNQFSATQFIAKYAKEPEKIVGLCKQASGDWSHSQTSGDWSHAQTSGDKSHAQASGDQSHAQTSGDQSHAQTSGDWSHAQTSGIWSHVQASGKYGVAVSTNSGWASAGSSGCIFLARYNGKRMIGKVLHVDIDAKLGWWYKLDNDGVVIERKDPPYDWPWKE